MKNFQQINVISLDLFDTLVRVRGFDPRFAFEKSHSVLLEHGIEIPFQSLYNAYRSEIRKYLAQREATGLDFTNDVLIQNLLSSFGFDIDRGLSREVIDAYFQALVPYTVPYPGMESALRQLKEENFSLILTSNHSWPAHGYKILKRVNIYDLFDRIIFSGEIGKAKPHSEIYQKAFNNYDKEEILHVGDNPIADVDGSQKFGVYALWIKSRDHYRDRKAVIPTITNKLIGEIRDITELPEFLGINILDEF